MFANLSRAERRLVEYFLHEAHAAGHGSAAQRQTLSRLADVMGWVVEVKYRPTNPDNVAWFVRVYNGDEEDEEMVKWCCHDKSISSVLNTFVEELLEVLHSE